MKFLHLFHKEVEFGNIEGYEDIKDIVRQALYAEDNYNLLFCTSGSVARAYTRFDCDLRTTSGMTIKELIHFGHAIVFMIVLD